MGIENPDMGTENEDMGSTGVLMCAPNSVVPTPLKVVSLLLKSYKQSTTPFLGVKSDITLLVKPVERSIETCSLHLEFGSQSLEPDVETGSLG